MKTIESGRSMIEMLGVLAIIGVLSVGGIAGYSRAMTKYRTNKTIDQVTMLVTNIRTLYAQQNNFEDLSNKTAYDLGVIPDDLVPSTFKNDDTNSTLKNAFKGNVYINLSYATAADAPAAGGDGGEPTAFEIAFDGLSREACIAMATSDWGSGSSSGLVGIAFKGEASGAELDGASEDGNGMYIGCAGSETTSAALGKGKVVACPAGSIRVPLSVKRASEACNCIGTGSNQCSITWKYF